MATCGVIWVYMGPCGPARSSMEANLQASTILTKPRRSHGKRDRPWQTREKGKPPEAKRENGKGRALHFGLILTRQTTPRACTHERTKRHETISRLVSHPPTSDLFVFVLRLCLRFFVFAFGPYGTRCHVSTHVGKAGRSPLPYLCNCNPQIQIAI